MAIKTYSAVPYVDDFGLKDSNQNNKTAEEKNFLRILFKPGVSVQVRELNQMQSILQNQIDKVGRGVFKEGPVPELATVAKLERNLNYVDIDIDVDILGDDGIIPHLDLVKELRLEYNPAEQVFINAEVLHYQALPELNRYRFFIKYINSAQDEAGENVQSFSDEQTIDFAEDIIISNTETEYSAGQDFGKVVVNGTGKAIHAQIDEGVFFVKGSFVYAEAQSLYSSLPSLDYLINAKLVFAVTEKIVNFQSDRSLLDNVTSYPNENAPGADRYTITLELLILSKNTSDNDQAFVAAHENIYDRDSYIGDTLPLLEVVNNSVVQVARPEFSGITDVLATRTREESGDYALNPYGIDITGFYNDVTSDDLCDRGLYSAAEMADVSEIIPDNDISEVSSGSLGEKSEAERIKFGKTRFVVGVEPSISYVDGYRVAEPEKVYVTAEKARKTSEYKQVYSNALLGSYILGTFTGAPSFDVDDVATIKDGVTDIATCRFRSLENTGGSQFKLYVYDIQFASEVTSLDGADTIEQGSFVYTVADATLYDTEYNKSIYPLPADYIEHVKSSTGDIEFTNRRVFDPTSTVEDDTVVISVSGETNAKFEELGPDSYIVIDGDGTVYTTDSAVRTGVNNDTVIITTTANIAAAQGTKVIASYRARLDLKSKIKDTITDKVLVAENTDVAAGAEFDLDHHDIIAITSAEDFAGMPISLTDLVLDNGQRDGCYKKGRVKYIGEGLTAAGAGTGGLKITYTYFLHPDGGDYFSASSYSSVEYDEIPIYKDMRLSDSLDFRPRLGGGDSGTHLDPNSTIDSQIRYYLSRIDKLIVTRNSEFKLITGIPEVFPEEPAVPADAMHLYTLYIPAYTFCHTHIDTLYVDNRRYTMRDIGTLSSRINSLEQYTTLSMLEKEACCKQIVDDSGNTPYDRFKNGIIVDSFRGHNIGNVLDANYNCSMSPQNPVLRPYFENRSVPFTRSTIIGDTVNVAVNDGLATLEYESGFAWIDQQKAAVSISVNPYDVATWLGSFKLSPSSDEWMETRRAPNIVNEVGENLADLRAQVNRINQLGTQWNSWQTAWTGTPVVRRTIERAPRRFPIRRVTTTTTQSQQIRTGSRTVAAISSVTRVADDRVIDVSFVPFIRARKVYFKGKLFKPNTKLRVFFDGKDITKYATAVDETDYKEWSENASVRTYHNDLTPAGAGTEGADIVTNFRGDICGWFVVPNNSEYQFPIGERSVVLTDGVSATDPGATTSADAVYTALGKVQTKQRTLITTRSVIRRQQRVTQSRLQTSTAVSRTRWYDPLAQSFIIGENPTGIFIHSVDLYFSHVSEKNIPIKMYLVEMENGYPTQRRVPLSDVTKQPDEVATSSDATAATTFEFDSPIYLQYGMEYAIVTESNSSHYRQWLSEVGKNDVTTGEFISKNPFLGVSFKSQNASTWSADQMKDFKMVVRRATYQSEGSIILNAVGISDAVDDESDGPLEFSQIQLNTDFIDHPETDISYEIKIGDRDWEVIAPNENHYVSTVTPITSNSGVQLKITLKSNDEKITPIVDLDRISLIAVKNVIGPEGDALTTTTDSVFQDGTDSEISAGHGNATAVYMTKEVILNNPSDRLDTYLNINRPYANSNVLVYARFKRSEDNIEDLPFERLNPPTGVTIPLLSRGEFAEIQYVKDFSVDDAAAALFTSFQVKIVLVSDDHALVPSVQDFRSIATV